VEPTSSPKHGSGGLVCQWAKITNKDNIILFSRSLGCLVFVNADNKKDIIISTTFNSDYL
jgi:hypothetical protein